MIGLAILLCLAVFLGLAVFAVDRHLILKQVETDLKDYLGDVLVARDSTEPPLRVHFEAQVVAIKTLIRKHFKF